MSSQSVDVTRLLLAWTGGDNAALNALIPLLSDELRRLANLHMRNERSSHTLQPTALLNEVYLRLVDQRQLPSFNDRAHFLAICAQLMRQILVDHARRHAAAKRGQGVAIMPLDEGLAYAPQRSSDLLDLDDALQRLSQEDSRKARVVELRFFGGMNNAQISAVLGVSENTIMRDWNFARAWLRRQLEATN